MSIRLENLPAEPYPLTPAQIIAVVALAEKRDRFLNDIQAAFDALAAAYAAEAELVPGAYEFESRRDGVYLVSKSAE